jgi:hypothetical protein
VLLGDLDADRRAKVLDLSFSHQSHRFNQRILGIHSVSNEVLFILQGILKVDSALFGKEMLPSKVPAVYWTFSPDDRAWAPAAAAGAASQASEN